MKNYFFKTKMLLKSTFSFFLIISYINSNAQILNFTIDTAIDNGTSITETLVDGSDTYILTADIAGSGAETLDDLGGGDLIFYFGSGGSSNTFIITLTKNSNPVVFTLNGIDYDTLEDGFISVVNQDDAEISANQEYLFGGGAINITNTTNATNISEFKILQPDIGDNTDFGFHNINVTVGETLSVDTSTMLENEIAVFPNPSNGNITIKNSGISLEKVTVIDLNGRIITSQNLNGITTNLNLDLSSKLSAGLYFIDISTENASTIKKLIIE